MTDQQPPWADTGFRVRLRTDGRVHWAQIVGSGWSVMACRTFFDDDSSRFRIDLDWSADGWASRSTKGPFTEAEAYEACAFLAAVAREREGAEQ